MDKNAELISYPVQKHSEYMKEKVNEPSDIEGMSIYDKYKMGLDYRDGSDTDYDGLTDKEEIEIYKTNPLKASTSGDLYTDGYKVDKGLDLFTYHEYSDEIIFKYNECSEVYLNADEPTDFYATVEDYTERYSLEDFGIDKVFKGYWIYNYDGDVRIDLTNILKENEIKVEDISVLVYIGDFLIKGLSDLQECNYEIEKNQIMLDYDFSNDNAYYIFITEKKSVIDSLLSASKNAINALQINGSIENEKVALIYSSPILEQFFGVSGRLYYAEIDDEEEKSSFLSEMIELSNLYGSRLTIEQKEKIEMISRSEIYSKLEFLRKILPMCDLTDYDSTDATIAHFLFNYKLCTDDNIVVSDENDENYEDDMDENYHTKFDKNLDELPFQNFETEYAPGGNCAGISHLTAYLFNTGSIPTSGSYKDINWDLSGDIENETLSNPGLSDYKTSDFIDERSGRNDNYIKDGLTTGEEEFVKMIGAFWKESNDKVKLKDYVMTDGRTNDWSLAEKMTEYLDQGKILCVGLLLNNGGGHEVNIYDYYYTDTEELIFRVYDSNIPQDYREGFVLNCDDACYLQCKKVNRPDGTESFTYTYLPIEGNDEYLATSDSFLMEVNSIVVTDEEWNVFND